MEDEMCLHFERGKEIEGRRREGGGFQGEEAKGSDGRGGGLLLYGRACK